MKLEPDVIPRPKNKSGLIAASGGRGSLTFGQGSLPQSALCGDNFGELIFLSIKQKVGAQAKGKEQWEGQGKEGRIRWVSTWLDDYEDNVNWGKSKCWSKTCDFVKGIVAELRDRLP